jgi:hypothetical protein
MESIKRVNSGVSTYLVFSHTFLSFSTVIFVLASSFQRSQLVNLEGFRLVKAEQELENVEKDNDSIALRPRSPGW